MSTRKKILIPGWEMGTNSFGATKAYLGWISQFGDPIIVGPTYDIHDWPDLIILPGGKDTNSDRYGEAPSFFNSDPDRYKEFFLDNNLKEYIKNGVPIFGICLGHQMLNIAFGGSLNQNVQHPYSDDKNRGELVHEVNLSEKYEGLRKPLKLGKKIEVNSLHHQGFDLDQLSPEFNAILTAPDDIVEAMEHKELPIASVQWHPEEIYDSMSFYLISKLLAKGITKTKNIAVVDEKILN